VTQYRAGYDFERRVDQHLTADGYFVVQSRGSHGHADLIAIKPGQVLLVQCKGGDKPLSHDEWNSLHALAHRLGALAIIADRPTRGRIRYRSITAPHSARTQRWPSAPFATDEIAP